MVQQRMSKRMIDGVEYKLGSAQQGYWGFYKECVREVHLYTSKRLKSLDFKILSILLLFIFSVLLSHSKITAVAFSLGLLRAGLIPSVILVRLLDLSTSQFPHLYLEDNKSTCLKGLESGADERPHKALRIEHSTW